MLSLKCQPEEITVNGTTFTWPETNSGSTATFTCPSNVMFMVRRFCRPGGQWETFHAQGCGVLASEFRTINADSQNVSNFSCYHNNNYYVTDDGDIKTQLDTYFDGFAYS